MADYFRDGFDNGDMCILVHSSPKAQIIKDFEATGLDIRPHLEKDNLRIFDINETYLAGGKFAADYMLSNVKGFISDAKSRGYSGVRTAGEMSWLEDSRELTDEAIQYEQAIDELIEIDETFTGLCMYRLGSDTVELIKDALQTHSSFIYDGVNYHNPYHGKSKDHIHNLDWLISTD